MSTPKEITPVQKRDIDRSAQSAQAKLYLHEVMSGYFIKDCLGQSEDDRAAAEALLDLKYTERRDLSRHEWLRIIVRAARRNDFDFFQKLGKVLGDEPQPPDQRCDRNPLAHFLTTHWHRELDGIPPLFEFGPRDLREICADFLRNSAILEENVIKTRQRLGLMPFKASKRKLQRVNGRLVYQQQPPA